jgi:hypothetical protein
MAHIGLTNGWNVAFKWICGRERAHARIRMLGAAAFGYADVYVSVSSRSVPTIRVFLAPVWLH